MESFKKMVPQVRELSKFSYDCSSVLPADLCPRSLEFKTEVPVSLKLQI